MTAAIVSGFDTAPLVEVDPDGRNFRMYRERVYTDWNGTEFVIPQGFKTDFATIPGIVAWAVEKLGAWTYAAIVHDLLCAGLNRWHEAAEAVERGEADFVSGHVYAIRYRGRVIEFPKADSVDTDRIFYRIARAHGVDRVTANLLWTGVRWGALFNAARREGFMRDFWPWLGLSLAYLPVMVLPAWAGRPLLRLARWVIG